MTEQDCQSYSLGDPQFIQCAATLDPDVYGYYTDLPEPILKSVLPENLNTLLDSCEGNSDCKLVSYDFQTDVGTTAADAEYVINMKNTDAQNKGLFIKSNYTTPVVAIEPPGYSYSLLPINPQGTNVVTITIPQSLSASDQVTSEMCARYCDDLPNCKAFNYNQLLLSCVFFSNYDSTSFTYGDEVSFNYISYTKDDVTSAVSKKQPNLDYSNTWLEQSGSSCSTMDLCNTELTRLINTDTAVGFSSDDLLACGACPIKTFKFKNNSYFVQDELGETRSYQSKPDAINDMLFSNVVNTKRTITNTQDFNIYNVKSYNEDDNFNQDILFVSSDTGDYNMYKVIIGIPTYTCYPKVEPTATWIDRLDNNKVYNKRDYFDNISINYTSNEGFLTGKCTLTVEGSDTYSFHTLCGNMCYDTAREDIHAIGHYYCQGEGYTGDSFEEGVLQDTGNPSDKICSKAATIVPTTSPITFYSIDSSFQTSTHASSNTFLLDQVDYVTNGFRIRHMQTQKYVSSSGELLSWKEKYSTEYNSGVFILSEKGNILDNLNDLFPQSKFFFQTTDGTKYIYDRTSLKLLQDIFSVFKLTFNPSCTRNPTIHTVPTFSARTLTNSPGDEIPSAQILQIVVEQSGVCQNETTFWLVIDLPDDFNFSNAPLDTDTIVTMPDDFVSIYRIHGINESLLFPTDSYTNESRTSTDQNLRQWITSKIFSPFGLLKSMMEGIETNAIFESYYRQYAVSISVKLNEAVNTRELQTPDTWSYTVNFISMPHYLSLTYDYSLEAFNNSFRTAEPWDDLRSIYITYYPLSNNSKQILDKKFYTLLQNSIDSFKSLVDEIIKQTNTYILEAYAINDDDLNVMSSSGSAGSTQEGVIIGDPGVIPLYNSIKQNKTDMDNLIITNATLIEAVQHIINGTRPLSVDRRGTELTEVTQDEIRDIIILNLIINLNTDLTPQFVTFFEQFYAKYEDSYQKYQLIKKVASPEDVPQIENFRLQQALEEAMKTAIDVSFEKFLRRDADKRIGDADIQALLEEAMKTAVDVSFEKFLRRDADKRIENAYIQDLLGKAIKTAIDVSFEKFLRRDANNPIGDAYIQALLGKAMKTAIDISLQIGLCIPGQYKVLNNCTNCPVGTYSDTLNASSCTSCSSGTTYQPYKEQSSCLNCKICVAGEYVSKACSVSSDRECLGCTSGTNFSTTQNADSCSTCKTCVAGEYVSTACSVSVNRVCTGCTSGTNFSTTDNAASCSPCGTSCGADKYISSACTASSDIVCSSCPTTCSTLGATIPACVGTETSPPTCSCPANSTLKTTWTDGPISVPSTTCSCDSGYRSSTGYAPCFKDPTITIDQTNFNSGPYGARFNLNSSSVASYANRSILVTTDTPNGTWTVTSANNPYLPISVSTTVLEKYMSVDRTTLNIILPVGYILDDGTQGGTVNITITLTTSEATLTKTITGYGYPYIISNWTKTIGPNELFGMYLPNKVTNPNLKYSWVAWETNRYVFNTGNPYTGASNGIRKELKYIYKTSNIKAARINVTTPISGEPCLYGGLRQTKTPFLTTCGTDSTFKFVYIFSNSTTGTWYNKFWGSSIVLNGGLGNGNNYQLWPNGVDGNAQIQNIA